MVKAWLVAHPLRHLVAIAIPLAVLLSRGEGPPDMPRFYVETASQPARLTDSEAIKEAREQFSERLTGYKDANASIHRNVYSWLVLIGLTVLLLVRERQSVDVELKGLTLPPGALHLFVIVSMLYLWMDFGSTLAHLIYERMAIWRLIDTIEGPLNDSRRVELGSLRPMLHGQSFMDAWSTSFLRDYSLYSIDPASRGFVVNKSFLYSIMITMSLLIGLAHASAFVLLEDARNLWGSQGLASWLLVAAQLAIALIIAGCYLTFQLAKHGEWFFSACSIAAATWIELLPGLTRLRKARVPAARHKAAEDSAAA
jgi:hypothetical protein